MTISTSPWADALLWPLNLVRDLPGRYGRLLGSLVALPVGRSPARYGAWLYAFGCYLFDLFGGPEIVQFFWRLATDTRPLTQAEIEAAVAVLGPGAVRYQDVRLAQGGFLKRVFRLNQGRAFATWHTINMPDAANIRLALLVHELTHTRQYERVGSVYIGQGLWVQRRFGRLAYDYGGPEGLNAAKAAGKRYKDYNREQQGQIAQDYCARQRAGQDTAAYEPFIADLQRGLL